MDESATGVFVSVAVSVFAALLASASLCSTQHDCVKDATCASFGDDFCSFQNVVSPTGFRLFNTTTSAGSLQALERGVCPVGERQNMIDGTLTCLRQRSFPSALNTEIMDASEGEYHRKYCGRWIDSQLSVRSKYWSLFDAETVAEDVGDAAASKYRVRNAVSNPGKFRVACIRMATSNSQGPSGQVAYEHLKSMLPVPNTKSELVTTAGVLAAHYCDGPAMIGFTATRNYQWMTLNVTRGASLSAADVSSQLYAAGESRAAMALAEKFADAVAASTATNVMPGDVRNFVAGSVRGTVLEGTTQGITIHVRPGEATHLARLLAATDSVGLQGAHAYLLGLAATCSYAVRGVITGEVGAASLNEEEDAEVFGIGHEAALGRLPTSSSGGRFEAVTPERMLNASVQTWSRLRRRRVLATSVRATAVSSCNYAMGVVFPDELDRSVFDFLVPERLYARMEAVTAGIQEAVRVTLMGSTFAPLLQDPGGTAAIVASGSLRIAGAPRSTWAGRRAGTLTPGFEGDDGALLMMLKQARAVFNDRVGLATSSTHVCMHPPLMPASSRNGYFLPYHGCAMLLPGIMVPPFAGADYDDESLYSRIGYVVAHEFAHATAGKAWNSAAMASFLSNLGYAASEYTEAIADIVAVSALVNGGFVSNATMCASASQLWCGTESVAVLSGIFYIPSGSHPPINERGNRICRYLAKYYA